MTTTAALTVRAAMNIITAATAPVMTAALLLELGGRAELLLRTVTASMMYREVCAQILLYKLLHVHNNVYN